MSQENIKVGITIGDINGVGPEVVIKALSNSKMFDKITPVIFCPPQIISFYRKNLKKDNFNYHSTTDCSNLKRRTTNIVWANREEVSIKPGTVTESSGEIAWKSLDACTEAMKNGDIDVMVTAPINKNAIQSEQFRHQGHTEYLKERFEAEDSLMILMNDHLKVALATGHIPLKEVSNTLNEDLVIRKAKALSTSLQQDFRVRRPKIALLSINPHSGDNGLIGSEEIDFLHGTIEKLKEEEDILAFGPFAADGFFGSDDYTNYDAILAMYHDQGLAPFKALSFNNGVNFTAGLPYVRTSPDHGTAYSLAGKNQANEQSFRKALYSAIDIYRVRKEEKLLAKNKINPEEVQKFLDRRNSRKNNKKED
jgi:4-hydroxythreonine-4-phosphate dehydrogenase